MGKKLMFFLAGVVLLSSMSMAARIRDRFSTAIPGVDAVGMLDLSGELAGEGILKGVYNDRNGRFVGTVRGRAPNLSGKRAVFRGDSELLSMLESEISSRAGISVELTRGVYRVTKQGRVSGSASGRASASPL